MEPKIHQKLSYAEQHRILEELDRVSETHARWLARIHGHLVCGTSPTDDDLDEESYLYCDVGRWLYQAEHPWLANRDDFLQLARAHQASHELVARLCSKHKASKPIRPEEYQGLVTLSQMFRDAQRALRDALLHDLHLTGRLLTTLFEHSQEGLAVLSEEQHILEVNESFTFLTGYAEPEVLGNPPDVLFATPQGMELYPQIWLSVRNRGRWQGELENRRKDGSRYLQRLAIHTVKDGDGAPAYFLATFSDITTSKNHEKQHYRLTHYDPLTGLPGRILFRDRLDQEIAYARRHRVRVGLLFIDLDHFSRVNQTYGHERADRLLCRIAERLQEALRSSDGICRYGGNEFVIVAQLTENRDAMIVADKVLSVFAEPFKVEGQVIRVTASIGVSLFPEHGADADALLQRADLAMYHAKNMGKDQFQIFQGDEAT
jgi:diguanylate cyclase (GGDEF)-like protein/PAS domain S-box-containing protein